MTMQNWMVGHDTVVPMPVYSVAAGMTRSGAAHSEPFHATTAPPSSAARQYEVVGHEIESSPPRGSMVCSGDHRLEAPVMDTPVPLTTAHQVVVGQAMAVASDGPDVRDDVHGSGSSVQVFPFQSSTEAPITAVHWEDDGHETPTRPAW
jgi:hypothetical protein